MSDKLDRMNENLRLQIIEWLQFNDPNGDYDDEMNILTWGKPLDLIEVLAIALKQNMESVHYKDYDEQVKYVLQMLDI